MSDDADLPPHVRKALMKLSAAEADLLLRLLRVVLALSSSGRLMIWVVGSFLGALIVLSQALDAAKKLLPAKFVLPFLLVAAWVSVAGAAEPRPHSNPWLLEWIPSTCCVTNDCCWQISENEVRPQPADEWLVISTGQTLKRTDWSPDGKFYRCACDYDTSARRWIRHQGAHTRCIFVPMRSALGTVR